MRVLGVDSGTRRIGLALSDPGGLLASPLAVVEATGEAEADAAAVAEAARRAGAEAVVVGLPLALSGAEETAAQAVREFAGRLEAALDVPVTLWDERLTTAAAERALIAGDVSRAGRRRRVDKVAAALLLQSYLDAHHGSREA